MRIARFQGPEGPHVGVLIGEDIADVTIGHPSWPTDLPALLEGPGLSGLASAATEAPRIPLASVALRAPVGRPPKLLAIGLNYAAHAAESATPRPQHQLWFNKQSTCVNDPGGPIEIPLVSSAVDYEGELAFVIGRRCRHVPARRAHEVVAGFTVLNDVSVRDWQRRTPTMTMGKSFDTHGPMGPWLVTGDELGNPHDLAIRTWVNDELRQHGHTSELLFNCWEMIEHLSTAFTLEPGDVISTGTPAGVGAGFDPPRWLVPGDHVRIAIDGIGIIDNPVIAEPAVTRLGLGADDSFL